MRSPIDSLAKIERLFDAVPRPERFGNPEHCSECAEHNETLLAHTPQTISLGELGRPSWDPICFIDAIDAFRYYLPALARLACGRGEDYYLDQFLFHLNGDRIAALQPPERLALAELLEELTERMPEEIEQNRDADVVLSTIVCLRDLPA